MSDLSSRQIWIDATGLLLWGIRPLTGIQRVELGLCEYVLDNPDHAGICAFDMAIGRFVPADESMLNFLRLMSRSSRESQFCAHSKKPAYLGLQLRFGKRATIKRLAREICSTSNKQNPAYIATKLGLGVARQGWAMVRFVVDRISMRSSSQGARCGTPREACPVVVASFDASRSGKVEKALEAAGAREANVIHDLIPLEKPELVANANTQITGEMIERILRRGNDIFAVSRVTADAIETWDHEVVRSAGTYRLHICPLNISTCSDPAMDLPIPELVGQKFALFCSTIERRKGHWLLVAAWRRLSEMLSRDALPHLVLIGRPGSGMPDLDREIAAAGQVADRIHVLHDINDAQLNWAYRNALLTLFPSEAEGWGLPVSESLAHGVPVIHADIPILHEAAQGLMPAAPVNDVDAWTEMLAEHFANVAKIDALSKRIRSDYVPGSPDKFARCVMSRLLGRRPTA